MKILIASFSQSFKFKISQAISFLLLVGFSKFLIDLKFKTW
jgi:hypothetical protein